MPEDAAPRNILEKFIFSVANTLEAPTIWVREKIVEPNQKQSAWYHQKFRRVPTIDECYTDDIVCISEANIQFKRDKLVDSEILSIMRERFEECTLYEAPDHIERCKPLLEQYQEASTNWFIKYGDLGAYGNAHDAYMKQKHRLIWERRHGPVGGGMKSATPTEE
ncbi:NADH dehydrogenase [ubiquinone] 1 beta subcomplex subunit 10 [Diabrotica virgifera virgifera]|uniref:NADH dehydrogenase [ubiquinone] 1 beta subcomplex subunit 10 n=1 Tax=Diabrotica virgifera virgifera TaxID=50390 RepID=A0ABM5ISP1_DIAVI|nr:NADH dehydrogenase [ubiquinone] 1 beta subcomplex subunit 10 [Diabrotica virgifera virgifera]